MKKNIFDISAPVYKHFSRYLFSEIREDIIETIDLESNDKILDVGGGTGALLEMIQDENPAVRSYLLDSSRKMIDQANKRDSVVLGTACKSPFSSDIFDYVVCTDALHHFKKKKESVEEMKRVLKPDGEIIIFEMDSRSLVTKIVKFGERLSGEPSEFFASGELASIFGNEFDITIERVKSYEYVLYAKRE